MNRYFKAGVLGLSMILSLSIQQTKAFAADYTIVSNDSLYKLGVLFDTDVTTLMNNNKLTSSVIYPGQILDVPAALHTVQSGDTLFLISLKYGISLDALREANNKWNDLILPGETLLIPRGQTLSSLNNTTENVGSTSTNKNNSNTTTNNTNTNSTNTDSKKTVISYTKEEVDLLARLITAEATGQPYDAMVAVGAVVVNRVESKEWPNSISSVIKQVAGGYYQFTPYKNGYINRPASSDAVKAAWDALYGKDPSNGAMFYFDDSSTNDWLWSKTITKRIGNMVYVK